ncbi:hypothetical protein [Pedobacter sp. Hv1]|uniref:hypothetical protein n=1 Tax=Pedobacter sp. Hv1 TaxID=1740090 RepID=UPI0006D8AE96|nr:hypothetical protein [Pedobacter sp. Hv1]KQC02620.1 hypothetical protein AQF98_03325 [Pedobacter sp. Hv1]
MKQKLLLISSVLILSLFAQDLWAQTPVKANQTPPKVQQYPAKKRAYIPRTIDTAKNTDPSLKGQYLFMLSRSKTINGYKLINPTRLDAVWQSVTDTLRKERVELAKAKAKITEQNKSIGGLQGEITGKEASLSDTNAKINEINFLGLSFTKGTYNIIVWSIILVLALALFIVIARSAKNILEAKHRTQLYDEISSEYQAYKAKSNEQQRKLARELQDERNIVEELKNKNR